MSVLSLFYGCVMSVLSLCYVCVMFVLCLCYVCVKSVLCLCISDDKRSINSTIRSQLPFILNSQIQLYFNDQIL